MATKDAPDTPAVTRRQAAADRAREARADSSGVPWRVRSAAAWSWRVLLIAAALAVLLFVVAEVRLILIPFVIAILLSALVQPVAAFLVKRGWPRALAAATVLLGGIVVIGLLIFLVARAFQNGYDDLADRVQGGFDDIKNWLITGPLHLSQDQIDNAFDSAKKGLSDNRDLLTSGAVTTAVTVGHVATGLLLALFSTFFLLKDGRQVWLWGVSLLPRTVREKADQAGVLSWHTLISYVRATALVALVDAAGIGLALVVFRVPLAFPLAVLVLLGAFIPLIGATLSGLFAVLVALVANGFVTAICILAAVILVQQLEGHVLQPLLLGRAVKVHPLAVALSIATGVLVAGIVGALVAVPLVAVVNVAVRALVAPDPEDLPEAADAPDLATAAGGPSPDPA